MLSSFLHDRAALYVSGAMTAPERENFELILTFHEEIRTLVAGLQEAMAVAMVAESGSGAAPPAKLKARLLDSISAQPAAATLPVAVVVTDAAGITQWINPAFTTMCGYTLDELKGRKPGHFLQGPDTDRAALARIRVAMQAHQPCRETLVNYHKNGTRYTADIAIAPVLNDDAQPVWFVAQERLVASA
jgi:PAS domain S-box-containing protein